jgi:adenylate kinase family enzyme
MNESTNQSIEFIEWKTKCFMIDCEGRVQEIFEDAVRVINRKP